MKASVKYSIQGRNLFLSDFHRASEAGNRRFTITVESFDSKGESDTFWDIIWDKVVDNLGETIRECIDLERAWSESLLDSKLASIEDISLYGQSTNLGSDSGLCSLSDFLEEFSRNGNYTLQNTRTVHGVSGFWLSWRE